MNKMNKNEVSCCILVRTDRVDEARALVVNSIFTLAVAKRADERGKDEGKEAQVRACVRDNREQKEKKERKGGGRKRRGDGLWQSDLDWTHLRIVRIPPAIVKPPLSWRYCATLAPLMLPSALRAPAARAISSARAASMDTSIDCRASARSPARIPPPCPSRRDVAAIALSTASTSMLAPRSRLYALRRK